MSMGLQIGGTGVPSGRTLFKPWPIGLKICTIIYLARAQMVVRSDLPFSSPFIGKRDMPGMASEEEKMHLECK